MKQNLKVTQKLPLLHLYNVSNLSFFIINATFLTQPGAWLVKIPKRSPFADLLTKNWEFGGFV